MLKTKTRLLKVVVLITPGGFKMQQTNRTRSEITDAKANCAAKANRLL